MKISMFDRFTGDAEKSPGALRAAASSGVRLSGRQCMVWAAFRNMELVQFLATWIRPE
jgi:hypothetical protein